MTNERPIRQRAVLAVLALPVGLLAFRVGRNAWDEVSEWWRLRGVEDLPRKTDPAEFGGGRIGGDYTVEEIRQHLCSFAGCGREGYAVWRACCDDQVARILCAEHDVEMNRYCQEWTGDPDWVAKIVAYANSVQAELDRPLEIEWLTK